MFYELISKKDDGDIIFSAVGANLNLIDNRELRVIKIKYNPRLGFPDKMLTRDSLENVPIGILELLRCHP